jgi:hypothetical protein
MRERMIGLAVVSPNRRLVYHQVFRTRGQLDKTPAFISLLFMEVP